jgi:hypothetical protein
MGGEPPPPPPARARAHALFVFVPHAERVCHGCATLCAYDEQSCHTDLFPLSALLSWFPQSGIEVGRRRVEFPSWVSATPLPPFNSPMPPSTASLTPLPPSWTGIGHPHQWGTAGEGEPAAPHPQEKPRIIAALAARTVSSPASLSGRPDSGCLLPCSGPRLAPHHRELTVGQVTAPPHHASAPWPPLHTGPGREARKTGLVQMGQAKATTARRPMCRSAYGQILAQRWNPFFLNFRFCLNVPENHPNFQIS